MFSLHQPPPPSPTERPLSQETSRLRVLILDASRALTIEQGPMVGASATLAAEEPSAVGSSRGGGGLLATSKTAAKEEEEGCKEQGSPCTPSEAEGIPSNVGIEASVSKSVASLHEGGTKYVVSAMFNWVVKRKCPTSSAQPRE
jgi:hypothetical protein